jgi:hypothetical protein
VSVGNPRGEIKKTWGGESKNTTDVTKLKFPDVVVLRLALVE